LYEKKTLFGRKRIRTQKEGEPKKGTSLSDEKKDTLPVEKKVTEGNGRRPGPAKDR